MSIYKLEDRVLFDAAAAVDAAEAQEAQTAQPEYVDAQDAATTEGSNVNDAISELMQDDYVPSESESELHDYIDAYMAQPENASQESDVPKLVLISDSLKNAEELYDAASEAGNLAIIYDADNTSADQLIQQIENILDGQKASSIAIAAEGDSEGNIDVLEADSDSAFWKGVTDYVITDGRIDFMGSNLADSNYVNAVAELTGLDVAASDDATGSAGDWHLEQGDIDLSKVYFDGLPPVDVNFTVNAAAEHHELVIINSSITDAEEIIDDLDNGVEILQLDEKTNALEQINDYLDIHNDTQYDTIRIISHGNEGYFVLNGEIIDAAYAAEHQAEFAALGEHLSADGDLMLYGCNLAANTEGQDLVNMISELTGADVAASTNDTSNAFDGDWHLEYTAGLVTTDAITVEGYDHHLASAIVTDNSQTALIYALTNIAYDGEIYYRLTPGTAYWNVVFVSNPIHIHGDVIISGNLDSGTVQFVNVGEDNHIFVVENTGSEGVYFMNCDIAGRSDILNSFGARVEADAKAYFVNVNMYGFKNVTLLNYGEVVLSNVNIHDNTGPQIIINHEYLVAGNTDFYNNTVSGSSSDPKGIVVHLGSTLSLANGVAYGNTSSSNAGFLTIDKHDDYSVSYAFVENFEIYQNSGSTGGAIYFYAGGAQLNLTNCNIHDNTASVYGGAIASIGGTIVVQDSQLSNNICSYNDTTGGIWGNSNFQFKGSFSSTNNSLEFSRDVTSDNSDNKTFTNSTVYYTGTSSLGQKIAALNYGALVLAGNNTKIFQNGTTSVGQQIEITDNITLSGSSSARVTVQVRNPYGNGTGSNISDFRVFNISLSSDETVTIENMTIRGGDISSYTDLTDNRGGAIRSLGGTLNLNNCIIEQSRANTGGGVSAENGIVNINDTIIQNNYATSCGGGIFNASIQMTINGGAVNGNYGGGGVALFSQAKLAIDGTHFENNHDGQSIIYFLAETTCENMVITNNNSNYYYLISTGWGQNITFNNCDIYDNSTTSTYYGYTLTVGRNATITLENGTQIYNNGGVENTIKVDGTLVIKGDSTNQVLVRQDIDIKSTGSFSIQDGALDFGETNSFIYSDSAEQEIVDYDYHNLILRNGTKTAVNIDADYLTIEGDITLSISGSLIVSNLTAGKSTVEYTGDATQTVAGLNYYNLTISGAAQRTLTGNIGIAGSFTADNTNFAHGNYMVTYNGASQTVAGLNYYDLAFSGSGIKSLDGDIAVSGDFTSIAGVTLGHNNHFVTYNGGDQAIAALNYYRLVLQGNGTTKTFQDGVTSVEQQIELTQNMTLTGSSAGNVTLQVVTPGVTQSRLFMIDTSANTVNISNITLKGGDVSNNTGYLEANYGGVILIKTGNVNLNAITVSDGKAFFGAGICSYGNLVVNASEISSNTSTWAGGGIMIIGGTASITNNTIISNNTASLAGGLYSKVYIEVSNTTISGNEVEWYGGGIWVEYADNVSITDSLISGNSAGSCGGGIFIENAGTVTLINTTVQSNTAQNGAGIYCVNRSTINITSNSLIGGTGDEANIASASGGGIYSDGTVVVDNSTIQGNTAADGGGLYIIGSVAALQGNTTITGNSATSQGNGIYLERGTLEVASASNIQLVDDVVILENFTVASDAVVNFGATTNVTYKGNSVQEIADLNYQNLTLMNSNKTAGGLSTENLTITGDITLTLTGDMTVNSFSHGSSTVEYSGDATQTVAGLNYYNLTISGTVQRTLAGDIGVSGSFTANSTNFAHGNYTVTYNGGNQSVTALNYYDLVFAGTSTKTLAGNIGIAGSFIADNTNFTHANYTVTYNGGDQAIAALDYYQLVLQGSGTTKTFQDGVTSVEQQIEITDSITFTGSSADNVTLQVVTPGVTSSRLLYISASGKTVNINNITLKGGDISSDGGVADGMGGTICLSYGDLNIANSVISDSSAFFGGGIHAGGNVVLDNTIIQSNTATQFGGGIYASFGTITLQNGSQILNNVSVNGNGGGICVRENAILNLNGSDILISGNSCDTSEGGGIFSLGTTNIYGATIENNSALTGAGIFSNNIINISNATIQNNSAGALGGGGIYINSGTVTISGAVIINGNTADGDGDGVDLAGGTLNVKSTASVTIGDKLRIASDLNIATDASLTLQDGSRVVYYGTTEQDILALDYYDLMFEHGAKTLAGDISIRGELTNYGTEFIHNNHEVNYSGADQNVAALDYYDLVFSGSGIKTLSKDINIAGSFAASNTNFAHGNYTVTYNGGDQAITALDYYQLALQGDGTTKTFQDGITSVEQQIEIKNAVTLTGSSADNVTLQIVAPGITHSRLLEINASGKTIDISNITLKGGNLSSYGGVLAGMGGAIHVISGNLNLTDSAITDSTAFYGGGIYSTGNVVLDNTIIQNNTATQFGGGIYASSGTVTLQNGSQVLNNISTHGNGGGICVREHATLNLDGSDILISSNSCDTSEGGGIYSLGTTNIWGATIENNSALAGAGIFSNNILNISNATIQNNSAGIIGGGGIYINNGTVTISGNLISNDNTSNGLNDGIDLARGTLSLESTASVAIGDQLRISGDVNIASDASLTLQNGSSVNYYGAEQNILALDYYNLVFEHGAKTLAGDISVRGELINYGTEFAHNSYKVDYSGADQNIAALDYYNLELSGSGTKTLTGDIGVAGELTVDGINFVHNNHAVDYNGVNQYVTGLDYYDLTLSGSGTKTLVDNIGMAGEFTIDNVDFVHNNYTVDYNGTDQNITALDYYGLALSGSGTKTLAGDIGIAGSFTVDSVDFAHNNSAVNYYGANQSIAGVDYYNLTLSGSGIKTLAGNVGIAGTLTIDGIDFAHGNQTVTFNGNDQNINALDYYNLVFGGTGVKTLLGDIGIAGTFTATDANFIHNNFTVDYNGGDQNVAGLDYHGLTFSGSGTKSLQGDTTLTGDWINNAMIDCGEYSVTFDGVTQHISGTGSSCFYDLVASTTGNTLILDQDVTINGVLDLDQGVVDIGIYTLTLTEGITGDLSNLHVSEGTINYAGNVIQVIAGITYHNLILSNSVLVTATDVNADNLIMSNGAILKLTGSLNVGTFTAGNGTVNYAGGDQTISRLSYNNLILSGSGTKTFLDGSTSVANNIVVNDSLNITGEATLPDDTIKKAIVQVSTPGANGAASRAFYIDAGTNNINISNLTIKGGDISSLTGTDSYGGALYVKSGSVNMEQVTIDSAKAVNGGGIYLESGSLEMTNSTIFGNIATNSGGGIYIEGGDLSLMHVTVAGNTAVSGGGIFNDHGGLEMTNSIVAYNTSTTAYDDIEGNIDLTTDYNVIGGRNIDRHNVYFDYNSGRSLFDSYTTVNSNLVPLLADNGGSTMTVALSDNSVAIGAGRSGTDIPVYDQRGVEHYNPPAAGAYGGEVDPQKQKGAFNLYIQDFYRVPQQKFEAAKRFHELHEEEPREIEQPQTYTQAVEAQDHYYEDLPAIDSFYTSSEHTDAAASHRAFKSDVDLAIEELLDAI